MSFAVSSTKQTKRPGSSKNPPPTHDKKKDTAVAKSVSELQKENDALKYRIECLEKEFDPKVFEKKSEPQTYALFEDALKSAEETIVKLRNGNSSNENTGELNKAKVEIKELTNKLNQKAKAEETLKLDLQTAQSERDDLKKQLTEARSNINSLNREKQEKDITIKTKEEEIKRLRNNILSNLAKFNNKDTEIASLKKHVEELKTTTNQSGSIDTKTLQKQLEQNKQEIDRLSSELGGVKKNLEIKKEEVLSLKDEKKAIESMLTTLKSISESQKNSSKTNTEMQDKIESMEKKINDKDTEIGKKTSEIDGLKNEIADLKKACHDAFVKLETKERESKKLEEDYKKKINQKEETIDTLRRKNTMEKTTPTGQDDVGDIKQQLSKATHEIDELKSRLSKMVGENLTNNNPNITDLSDENRPTKLAEIYSEMYDNEWTDAFEELEKQGSKELNIISDLLKILQDTLKFCGILAEQYIANLQKSASKLHEKTSTTNQYQKLHLLKELRKSYAPSLADEVFSLYVKEKNLKFGKTPKVEAYTRSCVKLSWLMSVQDPAVVIDEVKTPSKFDGDRYRAYTQSGTTMEFVVWPTMLLHSGGPILMKGVAQCK
ncbi:early endosome antigen 1-like isoform X2 [Dreissena polymorpha]|uniref:early endosome antigen 1-like isoform X2 n=1 Tax=Dreissena polymorpha TaxID=45954 RepID=UPI0022655C04|nr:early endosome antigen 1-like isoform X2 [Dreissena polymorpha]